MWSSDRRKLVAGLGLALLLAGCGFTPAYAPGGTGTTLRGQIQPREPQDDDDFRFAARFEDRLGGSATSPMELQFTVRTEDEGLAITSDQETLRYHLTGRVDYQVIDRSDGRTLTSGEVHSYTSYSAIGTTVATRASENDATDRLMTILADQLVTRLLATAGTWAP